MSAAISAEIAAWPLDAAVVEIWRELAVERENPFIAPDWIEVTAVELGEVPRVVVGRREGEVCAVLPLVEGRRGRARTLRFPGGGAGDIFEPACRREDEEAFASAAIRALADDDRWQILQFERLLDGDGLVAAMARAWPARGRLRPLRSERVDVYPYLEFGEGGIEAWLSERTVRVRKDFGKRVRKLERAGATVRTAGSQAELDRDFAILERLHDARWGADTEAMGDTLSRVHRAFAAAALRHDWLRLTVMELEGEPVAAMYAWKLGGRYMQYIGGYDPAQKRLGVGTALLSMTIRAAAEEGATVYDLMRGDEAYKRNVETGRREAATYLIARPGSLRARSVALGQRGKEIGRRLPAGPRSAARRIYRSLRRRG